VPEGESRSKDASIFNVLNFLLRSNQFLSFCCIYHIICHSLGSLRCNFYRFLTAKHDDEISWQKKHDDKIRTQICCHHVESCCGLSLVLHLFILASVHMTIVRLMYLEKNFHGDVSGILLPQSYLETLNFLNHRWATSCIVLTVRFQTSVLSSVQTNAAGSQTSVHRPLKQMQRR
jgi:hypothetical protein